MRLVLVAAVVLSGCGPLNKAMLVAQKDTSGYGAVTYLCPFENGTFVSVSLSEEDKARALAGQVWASEDLSRAVYLSGGLENDATNEYGAFQLELGALKFHGQLAVQAGLRLSVYNTGAGAVAEWHGSVGAGLTF